MVPAIYDIKGVKYDYINNKYDIKYDYSKYDIKRMMHPWVERKGYPVLTVIRNYGNNVGTINILIENINALHEKRAIPVSYTTRTDFNFILTRPQFWLKPPYYILYKHNRYIFDLGYKEDSWIIFNIQQIGYYRVNYDDENWTRISTYLNNEDYWKIHVLNRAQLIDDAFYFMLLNQLKADIFWQLTKYLERETDYIAWYPMFKAIEYMSTSFQLYNELHLIRPKLTRILNTLLQNLKYGEQPSDNDFNKILMQEAAQWACSLKMPYCLESALFRLKQHFENETKLSPWWKKWAYCYGLMEVNNITWHQTLNKIKGNDNDKLLYLITCPNYLEEISKYIYTSTTYTNDGIKSHITPSTMVQFELRYRANYQFSGIKSRQIKLSTAIVILINNIHSFNHLNRVRNAFKNLKVGLYGIPEKLEARKNQLDNYYRLFARINPKN